MPVEPLEHDGRPARLELGDDELEAGVALAHARLDEVGDGEHDTGKRQRAAGLTEGQTVVRGGTGEDVHGQRHVQRLRRGPEPVVPAVGVQAVGRRRRWDAHAHVAQLLGALHLGDGIVQVIELQARQREEPVWRLLAVVRGPVVIGREGRLEDFQVLDLVDVEQHAGIQHLRVNAIYVLILQALADVIHPGPRQGIALFAQLEGFRRGEVDVGHEEARDPQAELTVAKVELRSTVRVGNDDPRRLVTEALRQWLKELRRLHYVGVGGDTQLFCGHGILLLKPTMSALGISPSWWCRPRMQTSVSPPVHR